MNIEELKQRALQGDVEAYTLLCQIYSTSEGDDKFNEFIEFLQYATEQGDAEAPRVLADLYFAGWGQSNTYEMMRLFIIATERGNESAEEIIAYIRTKQLSLFLESNFFDCEEKELNKGLEKLVKIIVKEIKSFIAECNSKELFYPQEYVFDLGIYNFVVDLQPYVGDKYYCVNDSNFKSFLFCRTLCECAKCKNLGFDDSLSLVYNAVSSVSHIQEKWVHLEMLSAYMQLGGLYMQAEKLYEASEIYGSISSMIYTLGLLLSDKDAVLWTYYNSLLFQIDCYEKLSPEYDGMKKEVIALLYDMLLMQKDNEITLRWLKMDDKKAKLVSYLDVLTTEDLQNEEVAELKNLML